MRYFLIFCLSLIAFNTYSQNFTFADSLGGNLTSLRTCYDVFYYDLNLTIDDKVLDYIVEKAIDFKLGARGLRSICETIMIDAMFDGPSSSENKEFKLTLEYAQNKIENSTLQKLKVA